MKVLKIVFYNGHDLMIDRGLSELIPILEEGIQNYEINVILYVVQGSYNTNYKSQKMNIIYTELMNSTEMANFLRDKHIIIKANKIDTFSQVVFECMASGLVPILSSKVGASELIINGNDGFIYDQYEELKTILQKKIFLTKFGEMSTAAKKKAEEFRWEKIINEYLILYKNHLEKN
jgi:glycosyltransferase involved in cell wall biosynthesis